MLYGHYTLDLGLFIRLIIQGPRCMGKRWMQVKGVLRECAIEEGGLARVHFTLSKGTLVAKVNY